MDLTEAEDIKKRWQEYTEELYKEDLHGPDNHSGVITHLEPDTLEWEVKLTLGSITVNKASGGDGIPAEVFQILKDGAVKVLYSVCKQICKTQQGPPDWKRSVSIPIQMKGNIKERLNYRTNALISFYMLAKSCSKFSKLGFNSTCTENFQMCKLNLEKAEEPAIKLPLDLLDHRKSKRIPEKHLLYWLRQNFWLSGLNKLWKTLKEMGLPHYLTCLLRNLYAGQEATVRTGHGTMDWLQIGKGVRQGCILSPCLFNSYAKSTWCEVPGWMKHKLESRLPGEISITSDTQMTPPLWQKAKKN